MCLLPSKLGVRSQQTLYDFAFTLIVKQLSRLAKCAHSKVLTMKGGQEHQYSAGHLQTSDILKSYHL